jgi:hypothetical protein
MGHLIVGGTNVGGSSRSSAVAVSRLITGSYFDTRSTEQVGPLGAFFAVRICRRRWRRADTTSRNQSDKAAIKCVSDRQPTKFGAMAAGYRVSGGGRVASGACLLSQNTGVLAGAHACLIKLWTMSGPPNCASRPWVRLPRFIAEKPSLPARSATCVFASASLPDKKTTRFPPSLTGSVASTAAGSVRPRLGFRYTPPTAVTPHGGFCGGESQQWLSYPTNLHAGFCLGRRVQEATLAR